MIFATLEQVKNTFDPPVTTEEYDEVLSLYMEAIGQLFEEYCNRSFQAGSHSELHGAEGDYLYVRNTPLREVTKVETFEDHPNEYEEMDADDYTVLDDGVIFGPFSIYDSKQIRISYEGGYDPIETEDSDYPIPKDLQLAFIRQVQYDFKRRKDIGLSTVTFKDGSIVKPNINELLPQVEATLDRYRWINI